ncbi:hypothetical protein REPUB_Repub07fG0164200 [Reevesia pubescens]
MSTSRENSPDWPRSFQAPISVLTLSSDSYSSLNVSSLREDKTDDEVDKVDRIPSKKKKIDVCKRPEGKTESDTGNQDDGKVANEETSENHLIPQATNHSIWTLSLDSESSPEDDGDMETAEEAYGKHIEAHVSTLRLPLVLSEKVHRSEALVECEGDSIDLSGDMGLLDE